eukprot:TRINITY_DN1951_c0_g1_i1.p1 TRINITY_DN1951_c0_g1~~TRINITY_DN1951_c0_g1_i1.p1  ORF type:complete len:497 (+),score=142.05 TRINITY_DN1951_c0_g1_i1:202-1491(+)
MCDTFGPRFSGSTSLEQALDYVVSTARATDGLKVTEEPVMIPKWVRGNEFARLVPPSVRTKQLHMVGLGDSVGTPNNKSVIAPVLVVSSFDDLKNKSSQAQGKIVLFDVEWVDYDTTVMYRVIGASTAAKYGAVGVLIRSVSPYGLQTPHTGVSQTSTIPAAALSREDSMLLARMQKRGQPVVVELYMEAHFENDVLSRNIIIEIPGSEKPNEFVTVGGHMDSWDIADGAMDDGGGAFSSWEAVRLISQLGLKPKRTIRAILYVNEENGARGGAQYAKDHAAELPYHSLALETDEGTFTPYGLRFSGASSALSILQTIGQELLSGLGSGNVTAGEGDTDISYVCQAGVPCGSLQDLDPRIGSNSNNPCLGFSDKTPVIKDLIPPGYFWFHHTAADTPDKLSPEQLQRCAASLSVWIYAVANLPDLLPRN